MAIRAIHRRSRSGLVFTLPALLLSNFGCQRDAASPVAAIRGADPQSAASLLEQMVEKYQKLSSYEDAGELHLMLEDPDGQKQESPPIPFSVALERPNKIRVHSLQASIVTDGKQLRATAETLENQVLLQPCPERPTAATLLADPMLAAAAQGQIDAVMPQIVLLLEKNPIQALGGGGEPRNLEDGEIHGEKCHRVAIDGLQGTSVFWIGSKDGLLRKFEFPSDGYKKKFQAAKCSIWAEFSGARAGTSIAPEAFKFAVPEGAKLLKRLFPRPPDSPSPLLARSPEDFTFVDLNGKPVSRDSLKGKVAVLDLWATWCEWCFKGFPNLEKVYQQYGDNDKVVILAVSRDESAVSDANLREAFQKAQVTVPIVRDSQQLSEKALQVQVLPTLLILGADGTVQYFRIGYEADMAETLPRRIDRLLAGENLAQQELEAYQQEQKQYDERLNAALADDAASGANDPSGIVRKNGAAD